MGFTVRSANCWICVEPALNSDGSAIEPFELSVALAAVAHVRCLNLADLARRSVYRTRNDDRFGPNRIAALHIRTSGNGLLCKNDREREPKARVGAVRDFGGVLHFGEREGACAVCARELAAQVERRVPWVRSLLAQRAAAKVVGQPTSSAP